MKSNVKEIGEVVCESANIIDLLKQTKLKNKIAVKVNGVIKDLSVQYNNEDQIEFIDKNSMDGLKILRHSCAHIMAMAIQKLYPNAKLTIGPVIENGFYYDIQMEQALSTNDLDNIEKNMIEIIESKMSFKRKDISKQDAKKIFANNKFKLEIIDDIEDEIVSLYYIGDEFYDLCRGPHILNTNVIDKKSFKIEDVSGSYWRGNSKGEQLQRIYGTVWANKEDLQKYLTMIEESKKRDHRKLGPALNLFLMNDSAVGSVFWLKNGFTLFQNIKDYISCLIAKHGYFQVQTPTVLNQKLWEVSGHWDKFKENMFIISDNEENQMAIKPMNCPGHINIYQHGGIKSYRSLPYRIAEFGLCHRNEPSGALHGLMRLRAFTQDDAHIFCTPEQVISETIDICAMIKELYSKFGFNNVSVKFSTRPEKYAGTIEVWDQAEKSLAEASKAAGLEYTINAGEGAFYGPKLEFILKDSIGRDWQCGTLQVDFVLPQRFGLSYIDKNCEKKMPVMLHRALAGSLERFIGILIENYAGALPFWIAPVQIMIETINEDNIEYANKLKKILSEKGYRVETDYRNEKISYKVNDTSMKKIPIMLVCGAKEEKTNSVCVRQLGSRDVKEMSFDKFLEMYKAN